MSKIILILLGFLVVASAGCKKFHRTDMTPLDQSGMSFSSVHDLRGLETSDAEVAQIARAKQAGVSDGTCVELVRVARSRQQQFASGDAVAGLFRAGVKEENILELARLNQLGLGAGELQAMRLAGISDAIVLEVARRRAAGQPTLSGPSLAAMKNVGMSEATMLELLRRGAADDQADTIVMLRRRGWNDKQILEHYLPH